MRHVAKDIGETKIPPGIVVGQVLMIQADGARDEVDHSDGKATSERSLAELEPDMGRLWNVKTVIGRMHLFQCPARSGHKRHARASIDTLPKAPVFIGAFQPRAAMRARDAGFSCPASLTS